MVLNFDLKLLAEREAVSTMTWLVEVLVDAFPQCDETRACLDELKGADASGRAKLVLAWHTAMSLPLTAKYASAVERILNEQPTCYLACEYRDPGALWSTKFQLFERCKLEARYADADVFDATARADVWTQLRQINAHVLVAHGAVAQRAPSRDEIGDNISEHKRRKAASGGARSMEKAFQTSVLSIADELQSTDDGASETLRERTSQYTDAQLGAICVAWGEVCPVDAAPFVTMETPPTIWPFSDVEHAAIRAHIAQSARVRPLLDQMSSYCSVQKNIPTNVMGKIEDYAKKLAQDISSGAKSLDSLDLNRIGEEVHLTPH